MRQHSTQLESYAANRLDPIILQQAVLETGCGMVITDARDTDNRIVFVNPAFERMSGYQATEVLGRNPRFLQGPDPSPSIQHLRDPLRRAIENECSCDVVIQNFRKDGTPYWVELTVAPLRDAAGDVTHYIGIQTDITAIKQTQHALKEVYDKTLIGVVHAFVKTLAVTSPVAYMITTRLATLLQQTQAQWPVEASWQFRCAVLLSHLGCVALPDEIMDKVAQGLRLDPREQAQWDAHPEQAVKLLDHLPEFDVVTQAIRRQLGPYDPEEATNRDGDVGDILKILVDYDRLVSKPMSVARAMKRMADREIYHPGLLIRFKRMRHLLNDPTQDKVWVRQEVEVDHLVPGMIAAEAVLNRHGVMMMAKGQELTSVVRSRLRNLACLGQIESTIPILIQKSEYCDADDGEPLRDSA